MSTSLSQFSAELSRLAAIAAASTVTIGRNGRGTGVVIAPNQVLTNAHNLADSTTQITFPDGTAVQGEVLGVDIDGDAAVISAPTGETPVLAPTNVAPLTGAIVVAASRGHGVLRVGVGNVTSTQRSFRGPGGRPVSDAFEHRASLPKGSSGGPVVDAEGRLIGLNTHRSGPGNYLAIPFNESLLNRIATLASGRSVTRAHLGVTLTPPRIAAKLRSAVGLPEMPGALVREVEPDGPAYAGGVREGDLIVRVEGDDKVFEVDGPRTLQEALDGLGGSHQAVLHIVRGSDAIQVSIQFVPGSDPAPETETETETETGSQTDK